MRVKRRSKKIEKAEKKRKEKEKELNISLAQKSTKDVTQQYTETLSSNDNGRKRTGKSKNMAKHSSNLSKKSTQVRKSPKTLRFVIDTVRMKRMIMRN